MTKEEVLEKLEEEKESVKSKIFYGQSSNSSANGCGWCFDVINHAIDLVEQLDEPKKVIIPQFVDDWIEEYSKDFAPLGIVYQILNRSLEKDVQNHWRNDEGNQKLLLNAVANGYEVEKEPKYLVRIKGIGPEEEEWLNCKVMGDIRYFELNSSTENEMYKTYFTKQWLKDNWPEYEAYNNAGLLEFEEVEDD